MNSSVTIVGAGLAGCEAAWQCAQRGATVTLYEMKPLKKSPAHKSDLFCELVCSNSLRAEGLQNAIGLLKEELLRMGSLIMQAAVATRVPAGGALAVDRDAFAEYITEKIKHHPNITVVEKEITSLDFDGPTVIAAGPLASEPLAEAIVARFGEGLSFFDAAAPIVTAESIDMSRAYLASRYDKGTPDYINCPMNEEEYDAFYNALISAETAHLHGFENDKVFEGCMPVEVMAARGYETLLYGPLKPVGLVDPHTGKLPRAVVQLRKDNGASSLYNMVGFQTHLTWPEQRRVFGMIPGLERAEFVRYGVMHRNTFLCSPKVLNSDFSAKENKGSYEIEEIEESVPFEEAKEITSDEISSFQELDEKQQEILLFIKDLTNRPSMMKAPIVQIVQKDGQLKSGMIQVVDDRHISVDDLMDHIETISVIDIEGIRILHL